MECETVTSKNFVSLSSYVIADVFNTGFNHTSVGLLQVMH